MQFIYWGKCLLFFPFICILTCGSWYIKCELFYDQKQGELAAQDGLEIPNFGNGSDLIFSAKWSPTCRMSEDVISDDEVNRSLGGNDVFYGISLLND